MQQAVSEKEKEEEEEDEEEFVPDWGGPASSEWPPLLPSLSLAESEKASEDLFRLAMSVVDSEDVFIMHADEAFRRSHGLLKTLCMRLIFLVARCSGVPCRSSVQIGLFSAPCVASCHDFPCRALRPIAAAACPCRSPEQIGPFPAPCVAICHGFPPRSWRRSAAAACPGWTESTRLTTSIRSGLSSWCCDQVGR